MKYTGAWSISKLHTFETCKAQFSRRFIEKLPEPPSDALVRGSEIHDAIEAWFNDWVQKAHPAMKLLLKEFKALKRKQPATEDMWGFTKTWKPLENGFDKSAWIRAKTDAFRVDGDVAYVYDWKSGRRRDISHDQIRFYGVLAMLREPDVDSVDLQLWYVDTGHIEVATLDRSELGAAKKEFTRRANRIYKEARWPEEPGLYCKWCPFRRAIGGPCSY